MRLALCLLVLTTTLACGRHHVVPRHGDRIDGAASTLSRSDRAWTVEREPAAAEDPAKDR